MSLLGSAPLIYVTQIQASTDCCNCQSHPCSTGLPVGPCAATSPHPETPPVHLLPVVPKLPTLAVAKLTLLYLPLGALVVLEGLVPDHPQWERTEVLYGTLDCALKLHCLVCLSSFGTDILSFIQTIATSVLGCILVRQLPAPS